MPHKLISKSPRIQFRSCKLLYDVLVCKQQGLHTGCDYSMLIKY